MTIKTLSIAIKLIVLFIPGCLCLALATGCEMKIPTARDAFGTYPPAFRSVRKPDGTFEVVTDSNAKGKLLIERYNAEGNLIEKYDATLNTQPDKTLDAQGHLVEAMTPYQMAAVKASVDMERMKYEFWGPRIDKALDVFGGLLAEPLPGPVP